MKKVVVVVISIAFLATAGVALAQGWGRGGGMGYGPCGQGAGPCGPGYGPGGAGVGSGPAAGLNLSPEQTQKMDSMRASFFKETTPLRNEMTTKHLELRALWSQSNPDQAQILAKQKEINALRAQMQEKSTKFRLEARNILTPEQQAQFRDLPGGYGSFGPGQGMRCGYGPGRGMGMGLGPGPRW
jgi:zinc resistance-associated protein